MSSGILGQFVPSALVLRQGLIGLLRAGDGIIGSEEQLVKNMPLAGLDHALVKPDGPIRQAGYIGKDIGALANRDRRIDRPGVALTKAADLSMISPGRSDASSGPFAPPVLR